jgi:hypothetical protein
MGTPYLWYKGQMVCINQNTGDKATIDFKEKGWTSKNDFQCEGGVFDERGYKVFTLTGMWNQFLMAVGTQNQEEILIVKKKPDVCMNNKQFYFTKFVIELNNLNSKMLEKIAPTDSRLRPDMRAFENGNILLASKEKERLENKQRERKKQMELSGNHQVPLWFEFWMNNNEIHTKFKGEYFQVREKGVWPSNMPDLF